MAAGLGFKDFVTGEVLTAADVDGYLMQGIWVFASAAARDAAVTSPQEGNFAYLKDTNVTTYYTGSAWANVDTTGMTNPMTTTGDVIYSSPGSTPVRLGIGSTGNVLTVAGGVPTWAAPASGGGMTLLSTHSLSGSTSTISGISGSYKSLFGVISGATTNGSAANWKIDPNGNTAITNTVSLEGDNGTGTNYAYTATWYLNISSSKPTGGENCWSFTIDNYASTTNHKPVKMSGQFLRPSTDNKASINNGGGIYTNSAITSLDFVTLSGSWTAGTVLLYGVS
jgi:hypothetical protein